MQCPSCKDRSLSPVELERSLAALGCSRCNGQLLDLVGYRLWAERYLSEAAEQVSLRGTPPEPGDAMLCPCCERVMLRFRYTIDTRHLLDVCLHCENVWLQEHEWDFLKSRSLHGDLPKIFTDPWQRRRRIERQTVSLREVWDRRLGAGLHAEAAKVREWVTEHPEREAILDYLTARDPYRT